MPFKSKAQRRKFAQLLVDGKISPETYEEWNRETGRAQLPERVKPRQKPKAKRKRKTFAYDGDEANCSLAKTCIGREETTESEKARGSTVTVPSSRVKPSRRDRLEVAPECATMIG